MSKFSSIAAAVTSGDEQALAEIASGPLVIARNNFVERPWGGTRIRDYKRLHPLPKQSVVNGLGIGEAFELAAFDADAEAARYPSRVVFSDGSSTVLPELLNRHGRRLLGEAFCQRYGFSIPLLPKTLDVKELLSVQGHPEGHTEVYIIIDADPRATIALGFSADVDAAAMRADLRDGLDRQRELVDMLRPEADQFALHNAVSAWFASRVSDGGEAVLAPFLKDEADRGAALGLLSALKTVYWRVLDGLNHIEVEPGQVIYNATPSRLLSSEQTPSAEVHALGNVAGREVLALEVRLPGPTFRAWDNVRFPQREVDVDAALTALNLRRTAAEDFLVEERPVEGRPGVSSSVENAYFAIWHYRPGPGRAVEFGVNEPLSLHVLDGDVRVMSADGRRLATLARGEAALLPAGNEALRLEAADTAHVVAVALPC